MLEIASEIVYVWNSAYVKSYDSRYIRDLIKSDIMSIIEHVQKNLQGNLKQCTEDRKQFMDLMLKRVFDVSKCRCFRKKCKNFKKRDVFDTKFEQ